MPTLRTALLCALPLVAAAALPASAQVGGFSDVPATHWAAQSVAKLATAGVIKGGTSAPLGGTPQGSAARAATVQNAKKPVAKGPTYNGNRPVTRYELAVTLYRFVQYIEMADSQKKGTTKVQAAPIDGKSAVQKLIAGGYLPKNTPLATAGDKLVTANQLADAMAQVITRNREKKTPVTPGSLRTIDIDHPPTAPGT